MPADGTAGSPQTHGRALPLLLVVVFSNIAGFSLILPLLPFYGQAFSASAVQITMLFAAYSLGNVFGEIYWGRVSDRIGRKKVLTGTIACAALSYIAFAYAPTLFAAFAIRIVSGFFSGTLGVVQSYIADITAPQDRARSMGYFGASFNLGFAIGPAIGGLLARPELGLAGFHLPILAAGAFAGAAALWSLFALKETRLPGAATRPLPSYGDAIGFVASKPILLRLFILGFIAIAAFSSMEAVFGLWTEHNFGWSARDLGLAFIAVGATGLIVQALLIGPLVKRFGEAKVIVFGVIVLIFSMVMQPLTHNPVTAVILMSTLMAGHSLAFPNIGALVSRSTPADTQGSVLGAQMAVNACARIVAPPFFGLVYASVSPDAPYLLCALMMVGGLLIALRVMQLRKQEVG